MMPPAPSSRSTARRRWSFDESTTKELAEIFAELMKAHALIGVAIGPEHPAFVQGADAMERLHDLLVRMQRADSAQKDEAP